MRKATFILISLLLISFIACSRQEEKMAQPEPAPAREAPKKEAKREAQPPAPAEQEAARASMKESEQQALDMAEKKDMVPMQKPVAEPVFAEHFYMPMQYEKERKLEYTISIIYESNKFHESRLVLLDAVSKYGFILDCRTIMQAYPFLTANVKIKTEHLHEALKEFEKIGTLTSEHIRAKDHTEEIMITNKRYEREQQRLQRKLDAIETEEKTYYNWDARESDLIKHEAQLDDLELQQWRLNDKLIWASVHVEIKGPALPVKEKRIEVPKFREAFNNIVEMFLLLAYGLLWIVPYLIGIVILIVIWKKRESIKRLFTDKQ